MFDTVKVDREFARRFGVTLPPSPLGDSFQTKDLDQQCDDYLITNSGFLVKEDWFWVQQPDGTRLEHTEHVRCAYTGEVCFYTYSDDSQDYYYYTATFKDGAMTALRDDAAERRRIDEGHDVSEPLAEIASGSNPNVG